ncbi:hypothetical protein EG68_00973 [Paragonimus skrjabini miyazakii]|uniref:Uncharacterized protein n=1 Tax=Paragonimus skrjabini miyazakii TaxID=59628 RepID=A0A8S9ZB33_9TREM|nr:hypothetical protein EG68_00973 [Paragonimus skrjabini miyazakii]
MSEVPSIRIEQLNLDNDAGDQIITQNASCWLSVPDIKCTERIGIDGPLLTSHQRQSEQTYGPGHEFVGALYVTADSKNQKVRLDRELVWVQLYRKFPSISSRLNATKCEVTKYALFYSCPANATRLPGVCDTPLLCVNLKHSNIIPLDNRRFSLVTHGGEFYSVLAEVPDNDDLNHWIELLKPNGQQPCAQFSRFGVPSFVGAVRSAPGSPESWRRSVSRLPTFSNMIVQNGSAEFLKDIQETDHE